MTLLKITIKTMLLSFMLLSLLLLSSCKEVETEVLNNDATYKECDTLKVKNITAYQKVQ